MDKRPNINIANAAAIRRAIQIKSNVHNGIQGQQIQGRHSLLE
jgi:hypothetical protein